LQTKLALLNLPLSQHPGLQQFYKHQDCAPDLYGVGKSPKIPFMWSNRAIYKVPTHSESQRLSNSAGVEETKKTGRIRPANERNEQALHEKI
jgi:hypothetical protein